MSIVPSARHYRGGFTRVTQCVDCHAICARSDAYPVSPCSKCGEEMKERGAAIWSGKFAKGWFGGRWCEGKWCFRAAEYKSK